MLDNVTFRKALIALVCTLSLSANAVASGTKHLDVPAGDLTAALQRLAELSGVEFIYSVEQLKGLKTKGLHGDYEPQEAIRLLIEGTGLEMRTEPNGAILITLPGAKSEGAIKSSQGAGKMSSQEVRSDQTEQGVGSQRASPQVDAAPAAAEAEQLSEVIVTGSRIPQPRTRAQPTRIYSDRDISRSGETTLADFLNTLPDVSVAIGENGSQTFGGATTVQLHGLPIGTTLVLLDGRRVEASGSAASFFDLNNIPTAAIERVEVLPEGSSAVYGSDAIAGVVNVILKKDFDGSAVDARYGAAKGMHETDLSLAWGKTHEKGSASLIATYQSRTELAGTERALTADQDYRRFGGPDSNVQMCHPGNVYSLDGSNLPGVGAPFAAVPAGFTGSPTIAEFAGTAGVLNECSFEAQASLLPQTRRFGILGNGRLRLTQRTELFGELIYSRNEETSFSPAPGLFGEPGFQEFTVSASNPFNPFGETVGVADLLTALGRVRSSFTTDFARLVLGARGELGNAWKWEVAAWRSEDRSTLLGTNTSDVAAIQAALDATDPAQALNPFVSGPQASEAVLQSLVFTTTEKFRGRLDSASAYLSGPLLQLPAGPLEIAVGGQADKSLLSNAARIAGLGDRSRSVIAGYAEARVPLIGNSGEREAILTASGAIRYDRYSDFGGKATPQLGLELRPLEELLFRATYSRAFKAPNLAELFAQQFTLNDQLVFDPQNGGQSFRVTELIGGNSKLAPETGISRTLGFVYDDERLRLGATYWSIDETNSIQGAPLQVIVSNENLFPSRVIRNASGIITAVDDTSLNFGETEVRGLDYSASYRLDTHWGELSPSLDVTQTIHFTAALTPGAPATDRLSKANDDGSFAPRWKATAAVNWHLHGLSASFDGRYVGSYQDYDSSRFIGNFWLVDASLRYELGPMRGFGDKAFVQLGGVNLLNRLPQFSNFVFGNVGYDPTQADIRGRFIYLQLGVSL